MLAIIKTFFGAMIVMTPFTCAALPGVDYLNYIQNYYNQINTLRTSLRQLTALQNQAKNLTHVSNYQWQSILQIMHQMSQVMQQGQGLSTHMTNVDHAFRQRYPDYTLSPVGQAIDYSKAYQQWHQTTLDTLRNTFSAASIDAAQLQSEQAMMDRLKGQGGSATGRLQALQVVSEIAGQNVNQLRQLRQLLRSQMSAQNAYMAYHVSQDSYTEKQLVALVNNTDTQAPRYKNNPAFGVIQP